MRKKQSDRLLVELDGPGIKPSTVDPVMLLQLAESFFRLVLKVADEAKLGLSLRGLKVRAKCAAIQVVPSDQDSARIASERSLRIVKGEERAPKGTEGVVSDIRKSIRALPKPLKANVRAGAKALRLVAPAPQPGQAWEATELRVTVVEVGGPTPGVRLANEYEARPFNAELSAEHACVLGKWLYQEIDVNLELCRDVDGNIEEGRVLSVHPISDGEPVATWRAWFADSARASDEVDDVQVALGRE